MAMISLFRSRIYLNPSKPKNNKSMRTVCQFNYLKHKGLFKMKIPGTGYENLTSEKLSTDDVTDNLHNENWIDKTSV